MATPITISRSITLNANAERVWQAVNRPAAFRIVTRGLIRWLGVEPDRAEVWREGETHSGLLLGFGVLPISRHTITIERLDGNSRELQSSEQGGVIRSWRHLIRVTPIDDHTCRYEDIVEIEAGLATPIVGSFASWFYGIRQKRWQELALAID